MKELLKMKSKYIGVYWSNSSQKWYSKIRHNGSQIHLGMFDREEDAALTYDEKAYELRGDNAKFNFRNNHHICEAENCTSDAITKFQGYWVCQKHKSQLKQNGEFLHRTIYDKNDIEIKDGYAYISLYNKKCEKIAETIIDIHNIEDVKDYKWYLRPDGYVATNNYHGIYMYLHSLICNKNDKHYVDHKDRNKLNNIEENLREADGSENQMNKGIRTDNTSGKVGVHWAKDKECWCAMICIRGNHINLGYFDTFDKAVDCRIKAEHKYFQEFRATNERIVKGEV
jgi:hypothetical protein